jgi:hypothetical protein
MVSRPLNILACEAFVISDYLPSMEGLKDYVVFTEGGKDLEEKIRYYLARPEERSAKVRARLKKPKNAIEAAVEGAVTPLVFYLSDAMLDLDKPIVVRVNGVEVSKKKAVRSLKLLLDDAHERMDRAMIFSAKLEVRIP